MSGSTLLLSLEEHFKVSPALSKETSTSKEMTHPQKHKKQRKLQLSTAVN